ncbi:uncharacterized protein EV422DRAFT_545850 [Fimicolochytrium jonesii]|uniref:uncharacterized protein n=1 Tax=Fimicolochytrium jonesii TaxID=1396493 RepID=UPI0022FEF3DE|nr:uncharacterized protein EV422DRAFT_545850 [Fimicolochytrium jonesii]KAI8816388.1 hypothetical protein EV422DRAFT_545850 [Fimicolochytrium jonesii]
MSATTAAATAAPDSLPPPLAPQPPLAAPQQRENALTHPTRNSIPFVLQATTAAGITGASLGALFAVAKGQSHVAWGFGMGANWVTASLPFFGLREGILHYRYARNAAQGIDSFRMRNKDELVASIASGAVVGAGLGFVWRGPKAIIAGSVMYSLIACSTQTIYLLFRQYRLRQGLAQHIRQQNPSAEPPQPWSMRRLLTLDLLRPDSHLPYDHSAQKELDPIGSAFIWARDALNRSVDLPEWASPLLNAFDVEYRKRLNVRLEILEVQVRDLRESVERMKKAKGVAGGER